MLFAKRLDEGLLHFPLFLELLILVVCPLPDNSGQFTDVIPQVFLLGQLFLEDRVLNLAITDLRG